MCNQAGYFEEALKMRNLLAEFRSHPTATIIGFREHIFTGAVSSIASYMALQARLGRILGRSRADLAQISRRSRADLGQISGSISSQEGCFVTLTQRVLADPLAVRLHYGHPDVFDKATVSAMIPPAMIPSAMIPSAIISRRCISIRFVSRLTMLSCVPGRSSR